MVQDQLVDYINAQTKLGTSREAIKAALVGVGWQAADIDDSLKKVDGLAAAPAVSAATIAATTVAAGAVTAKPSSAVSFFAASATKPTTVFSGTPVGAMSSSKPAGASEPQVIRMSDLISASDGPMEKASGKTTQGGGKATAMPGAAKMPAIAQGAKMTATTFEAAPAAGGSKKPLMIYAILGILVLVCAGATGYLYMQNSSLSSRIDSVDGQGAGVATQVASLTAQVNALTASSTALAASMTGLTSANQELMTELSFYAAPLGAAPTSTSVSVVGSLGINASKNYFVVASYGGKVLVANSKDSKVAAALQPLVGSSTQLMGTLVPGSDMMTVASVNGAAVQ